MISSYGFASPNPDEPESKMKTLLAIMFEQ